MLRHESPPDSSPEALEPGEQLVAPAWRVIVRGAAPSLTGGPFSISDRNVRFRPTWSGLQAVLHSSSGAASPAPLCIPRARISRVSWEHAMFFLRSIRMEFLDKPELHLFGSRDVLQQIGAILGAVE